MPAGTPGDVEFDLDDAGAPERVGRASPSGVSRLPGRLAWAAAGLAVGVLLGHVWLPAGMPEPRSTAAPAPVSAPTPPVRVSFGAYAPPEVEPLSVSGGKVDVLVPAVVVNETSAPLVVRALRVSGPGAGLGETTGYMFLDFPLHLPPGEPMQLPFTLTSDCAVAVRPVPRITLVVAPDDGSAGSPVDVTIPDLGSLWGRTLAPALCRR
jgi:hypothetical protein